MAKIKGAVTKYLSAPYHVYSVYETNIIVFPLSVKQNFNIFYSESQSYFNALFYTYLLSKMERKHIPEIKELKKKHK